ncbi:hypothetical protein K1T35_06945 [Pseudonocardia sp. DSM 110487]|uniref:MauE/DoxX family redox-associated membrane protein n=1 Tax=Pseudonocardia sp. DSM 110487 TaxID=2865833 RepID=UPI001C69589A|nr:MauE/DoxX family redox-associated membrane protein [Pseudonocardia sp. DSM 110487]QYN36988.1 hypothetical protein K1T35_06945 [Pseudonocardia sp. DSM 110487]
MIDEGIAESVFLLPGTAQMAYLLLTVQFVVGGVFAVSAFGKVRARSAFVRSLADFGVPERIRALVGATVMVAEIAVVVLVLAPVTAVPGLVLGAVLFLGFAVVVGMTVRRGRRPRCRCFGVESAPLRGAHAVRNVVLAALAVIGALVGTTMNASPAFSTGSFVVAGLVAAVVLAVVVGLDDLLDVVAPAKSR